MVHQCTFDLINQITEVFYSDPETFSSGGCTLENYIDTITYFYREYKRINRLNHPRITNEQMYWVMDQLFCTIENEHVVMFFDPDECFDYIDEYFRTEYRNCDYSIRHFVSGDIRLYLTYKIM